MNFTYFLKQPKSDKPSLILFSCYFKYESKKFVYSTGEKIHPKSWDFEHRQVIKRGKLKASNSSAISVQLNRYEEAFEKIESQCKKTKEEFTSRILKKHFDEVFKKAPSGKNIFYDAFDEFVDYKTKNLEWSKSTIKRYTNIKNMLQDFEEKRRFKVTFNGINDKFHAEFTDFCMNERGHINNTYSRNLGLIKTFLFWAVKNGYTYNTAFEGFVRVPKVVTKQIALELSDLEAIMKYDFKSKKLEKVRDVFVFSCVTGLRFGELKSINKENVTDKHIVLKEEKGTTKESRMIPLNDISKFILSKYNYRLPLIANQKYNEYIKEVFKEAGYIHEVEKVTTKGQENVRETMPFYERVSSHTARRTFITMLKREKYSDKLIGSITGHKDFKSLNQYYQVDDTDKSEAVKDTFKLDFPKMKKIK